MIFIYIFVAFILSHSIVNAEIYFMLPNEIEVEDVNKNIKFKTKNRYTKAEQIQNQYKGKLKYKPSNSMIKNDRKGRYYTSVSYLINKSLFEEIEDDTNKIIYQANKNNEFKDSFSAEFGLYFRDNMSVGIEYFFLSNKSVKFNNINIKMEGQAYFVNLSLENNYSKIIPFFGVGAGLIKNTFKESFENDSFASFYSNGVKGSVIPAYQIFGGIEYMYSDKIIVFAKFKYMDLINDIELNRRYQEIETNYLLKLDTKSNIALGFKYLW